MMGTKQIVSLLVVVIAIVGAIVYLGNGKVKPIISSAPAQDVVVPEVMKPEDTMMVKDSAPDTMMKKEVVAVPAKERIAEKTAKYDRAKEITNPSGFVNTNGKPVKIADYVGKKVILLDIMTYSCINCIRTYPYINDWYSKYEDKGLIVIGIHTPEFDFEKVQSNVEAAMKKYGIKFPVVLDNDYGTWSAYKNLYWPRKYLIDIDGFVRYDHIGEGGYAETEEIIKDLLKDRAEVLGVTVDLNTTVTTGALERQSFGQSPETYLGSARNEFLANGTPGASGTKTFSVPSKLSTSKLYLDGTWNVGPQYAESVDGSAAIVYSFSAKKVFLVMSADTPTEAEILIDGKSVSALEKGEDVKMVGDKGIVTVSDSRLYSLYAAGESSTHTITIRAGAKGLKAFAFTFGN
jgi:thiol-disulfide isomerase/thioredoxin